MRKVTCPCDQTFSLDIPETINLDEQPQVISSILDGSFLSCVCPRCGSSLNLDLPTRVEWPSKKAIIHLVPEVERISVMHGGRTVAKGELVVVGYSELADRIAVHKEELDILAIESLKIRLLEKARESNPQATAQLVFEKKTPSGDLEFHLHGLREGEVAITVVPYRVYEMVLQSLKDNPDAEEYTALINGPYISAKNILLEDGDLNA